MNELPAGTRNTRLGGDHKAAVIEQLVSAALAGKLDRKTIGSN